MTRFGCSTKEESMYRDPMLAEALRENHQLEAENRQLEAEKRILEQRLAYFEGDTPRAPTPAPKSPNWGQGWILVFAFVLLLGFFTSFLIRGVTTYIDALKKTTSLEVVFTFKGVFSG